MGIATQIDAGARSAADAAWRSLEDLNRLLSDHEVVQRHLRAVRDHLKKNIGELDQEQKRAVRTKIRQIWDLLDMPLPPQPSARRERPTAKLATSTEWPEVIRAPGTSGPATTSKISQESQNMVRAERKNRGYARLWTNVKQSASDNARKSRTIDKSVFDSLVAHNADYEIFVLDRGEYRRRRVGKVYLSGQPAYLRFRDEKSSENPHITPLEYRVLVRILKNLVRKRRTDAIDLVAHCWRSREEAQRLHELKKADLSKFDRDTTKVRKTITHLSDVLIAKLGVAVDTARTGSYELTTYVRFCVLELF